MAQINYKFTVSSGSVVDLTSTSVNDIAAPTTTPRQGGFTLRNRINFTNIATANKRTFGPITSAAKATAGQNCNQLRVLQVPKRTWVKQVTVHAVESETVPGHLLAGAANASTTDAMLTAGIIGVNGAFYNDGSQTASSIKLCVAAPVGGRLAGTGAGAQFGGIHIQKADAGTLGIFTASQIEAVDSSMTAPWLGGIRPHITSTSVDYVGNGQYFPHGGFIYLALGPHSTALGAGGSDSGAGAVGMYGTLTGTWDVMADAYYVPE